MASGPKSSTRSLTKSRRQVQGGKPKRGGSKRSKRAPGELPTREEILEFVRTTHQRASKREIAKAFGIKGAARVGLKSLLRDMTEEGLLSGKAKDLRAPGSLPSVTVLDIVATDADGDLIAEPATWDLDDGPRPRGRVDNIGSLESSSRRGGHGGSRVGQRALGEGDRILARITLLRDASSQTDDDDDVDDDDVVLDDDDFGTEVDGDARDPNDVDEDREQSTQSALASEADGKPNSPIKSAANGNSDVVPITFSAKPMKRLNKDRARLIGIYREREQSGGMISPVDKKSRDEYYVRREDAGGARDGDLVRFDTRHSGRASRPQARVIDVLGNPTDQRQISLIAIHTHNIPDHFGDDVLAELEDLPTLERDKRIDLTNLALLTIDPPDARDHDDAVHAEPDTADDNRDGYVVTVAIADVAAYVRPGTRLDREAQKRGNSCYFPDRVVPMLPELISNDLCSLREKELRPCLAVRMRFDKSGSKLDHTFQRAVMRSAAKLSYLEAQECFDRIALGRDGAGIDEVLTPLWRAYVALRTARKKRAPLDLDLPERKIVLDNTGHVSDITVPDRLDAHKLIEEFMIQANVAAAETLERASMPCVYRIHDQPSKEKLKGLRDFLETLGMKLPAQNVLKPGDINKILEKSQSLPVPQLVSEVVLRSQSQAEYALDNIGHFGLNLSRYAHFTSPIRRYADLLVHRALITALKLGPDGLDLSKAGRLPEVAQLISDTERRAMAAERDTVDRLVAAFLAEKIGAKFPARVSGVVKFGLFVRLDETGADGFVPAGSLAGEGWYEHDEDQHALIDRDTHRGYRLGDAVTVRLVEAAPVAGALRFEMLSEPNKISLALAKGYRGRTPRRQGRGRRAGRGRY